MMYTDFVEKYTEGLGVAAEPLMISTDRPSHIYMEIAKGVMAMSIDNTDISPDLHEMHERLKLVAAAYLMAYEDDVQDIGTPNALAQYFLDQVIEQSL